MANPIVRKLQLILDRIAAKRAEKEAKGAIGGIETAAKGLEKLFYRIGFAIGSALGIRALIRFGKTAVEEAQRSRNAWNELRGTVESTGESFDKIEGNLVALSKAFQDATVHTDEDYAESLTRLITITGDVSASTNNMGLVANVAAQFYKGELGPAVELVSKVMNGNLTLLQRMGIHVKSAQEGLEVLAERSFGAAERQAGTFSGKLKQLTNLWGDFKEGLGEVLISGTETTGALDLLQGAVRDMIKWVEANKDELRAWVSQGIQVAINALRALGSVIQAILQLRGRLSLTSGTAVTPLGNTKQALEAQIAGFARQRKQLEEERAKALKAAEDFEKSVRAVELIPGVGLVLREKRANKLALELQAVNDQLEQIDANAEAARTKLENLGKPSGKPDLFGKPPMTGENLFEKPPGEKDEFPDLTEERFKALSDAIERAREQAKRFAGADLKAELRDTARAFEESQQAAATMAELMAGDVTQALDPVGTQLERLDQEAADLTATMQQLAMLGLSASDPLMQQYAGRLQQIRDITRETTKAQQFGTDVAHIFGEAIGAAMGVGIGPFAAGKAKQTALEAAEEAVRGAIALLNPFTAPSAAGHFAAAGKFAAISAGWAALAAGFGSGGQKGGSPGAGGLSAGREASGAASERASVGTEVHLYFKGPEIFSPAMERFVVGNLQTGQDRFGKNAKIHVHKGG